MTRQQRTLGTISGLQQLEGQALSPQDPVTKRLSPFFAPERDIQPEQFAVPCAQTDIDKPERDRQVSPPARIAP
jgi:hypothetical protein